MKVKFTTRDSSDTDPVIKQLVADEEMDIRAEEIVFILLNRRATLRQDGNLIIVEFQTDYD